MEQRVSFTASSPDQLLEFLLPLCWDGLDVEQAVLLPPQLLEEKSYVIHKRLPVLTSGLPVQLLDAH